jgi:pyruvate dehydrogenase E1 component alpha subunit
MSSKTAGTAASGAGRTAPRRVVEAAAGRGPHGNGDRLPASRRIDLPSVGDLQILGPDGRANADLDPDLPDAELLRVYRAMVLTRKFDVRMLNMQRQGKMGTFAPGHGQEATQIGQVYPLTEVDWFAPSYRSFGAQIWRGWEMERLLLLWDGFFEGFPPPPGLRDLPFSIVIGSHVLPAVGVALGIQYRDDEGVVVVNFGDGALSQGAVAEAMNFAAVGQAPVVFVCENNGWAISTPTSKQCGIDVLAQRAVGFGMPGIRVDGNDVLGMISAATEAVARARRGEGPTFIEAVTYRMGVHTTADDPKVYRSDDEVKAWEAKCPIVRFERYLAAKGLIDDEAIRRIAGECEAEVQQARERFEAQARPKPREVFDFVYRRMPEELEQQKREYLAKLDRRGVE